MFAFLKTRRARLVVSQTSVSIAEGLKALSAVDRSATLAIANGMLLAAGARWGSEVLKSPMTVSEEVAGDIIFELQAAHTSLRNDVLSPLQKRNMDDVIYSQVMRQLRATEVLIITYGVSLDRNQRSRAIASWKNLWMARNHASDAVKLLVEFYRHSQALPIPEVPGRRFGSKDLFAMASQPPGFLRKSQAKPAAKATPIK